MHVCMGMLTRQDSTEVQISAGVERTWLTVSEVAKVLAGVGLPSSVEYARAFLDRNPIDCRRTRGGHRHTDLRSLLLFLEKMEGAQE